MSQELTPCCKSKNWADLDCPECHGSGDGPEIDSINDCYEDCEECDGDGYVLGEVECLECGESHKQLDLVDEGEIDESDN